MKILTRVEKNYQFFGCLKLTQKWLSEAKLKARNEVSRQNF